ncbi:sugar ABC transporter ATP-binding protein [Paenibacillus sp. MSJ-34]|uniref:sugar ABC transporter ATP-binding protein n=1 Tax=Paenibacillus sp. MSJ-34 TaxID=2841529 RepID=UPI001C0F7238|nr:sugar ABC transporter ATP-binding protein [Paenibacillus sp. MSJ-34]MBU5442551.1 sugar ABC transporter ATP-binding protein [Paenibacillus sp. MSJ-34]
MTEAVLQMNGISKAFNGVEVLKQVDFSVDRGEVHALVGGNGAGKSTLMKILTGVYVGDSGEICIDGKPVHINEMNDARRNGISMIFQEFSLIPTLTVAQNIFMGREPRTSLGFIDDKACANLARELLAELRVDVDPNATVESLGVGYWQMTEIAKAISQDTKILIMDEPTSSLTTKETEVLFDLMDRLKKKGISIIYISHRMDEILHVCDRATVLRDGKNVITAPCAELTMDELVGHIIGGNMKNAFDWKERAGTPGDKAVLQVKDLYIGNRVNGVSFDLREGEVLGFAGLMGSGRTETMRGLFGIDPIDRGEMIVGGKKITLKSPRDAIKAGLALVPEDRRVQGLILEHSVKDNMLLPILSKLLKGLFIDDKRGKEIAEKYVDELSIKTDDIYKSSHLLSGGNQQKIILAKWLANDPQIFILDEPTIGVDIGAKSEIIEMIRRLADSGKSIIVVSSELAELNAVCDRVLVMKDGAISQELLRKDLTSEEVLEHAVQS